MSYDNSNRGILSRNDRKEKDTHPDFKGEINVNGKDYWLSGYVKERKDGNGRFFSLSVKPKEVNAAIHQRAPVKTDTGFDQMDSDIPF